MNIFKSGLVSCFLILTSAGYCQVGPILNKYKTIEVSEKCLLRGELELDSGLVIKGTADFIHELLVSGSFEAGSLVKLTGLQVAEDAQNDIMAIDTTGTLRKVSHSSLAISLKNTGEFNNLDQLEVGQSTILHGEVVLPEGTIIKGDADFTNGVEITGDLGAAGSVHFSGLVENTTGEGVKSVLILNADGRIEVTPLSSFSPIFPSPPPQGPPGPGGGTDCPIDLLGNYIAQPAFWKYKDNIIYTNECTPDPKVGIGTTMPQERLEVKGNIRLSSLYNEYMTIGHDGSHSFLETTAPINGQANNGDLHMNYATNNGLVIGDWLKTKTSNLSVAGHIKLRNSLRAGSFNGSEGRFSIEDGNILATGKDGYNSQGQNATVHVGDNNHYIRATYGKGISIGTYDAVDGIYMEQGGNVGIGTGLSSPSARLHVKSSQSSGNLFALENNGAAKFKVTHDEKVYTNEVNVVYSVAFPDYVFKKDYELMSLEELGAYIEKNGRLPKMPSAEEVAKKGADLGELVRVLVEKNEELTLYMLQLAKDNQELKNEIEAIKKTIK